MEPKTLSFHSGLQKRLLWKEFVTVFNLDPFENEKALNFNALRQPCSAP